jgi:hypothetical protein
MGPWLVFSIHINEKKMILHTFKLTSGFWGSHKRKKMILHICELTNGFLIHICEEKNDVAHLLAHKWFFGFTDVKERMILHTCNPRNGFWIHTRKNKMILHKWELVSDFFNSHKKDNKWYCTFVGLQMVFKN